jgi:hypothetical protein
LLPMQALPAASLHSVAAAGLQAVSAAGDQAVPAAEVPRALLLLLGP